MSSKVVGCLLLPVVVSVLVHTRLLLPSWPHPCLSVPVPQGPADVGVGWASPIEEPHFWPVDKGSLEVGAY